VLWLCAEKGIVRVGVIAVDGTKVHANASHHATREYEQIAREILEHADAVDAEEDERFGDARGDELPEALSTLEGRQRWLRDARRRLDERRAREARPIPEPRPKRLKEAKRRLEEDHQVQLDANTAYEEYRRHGRMKNGRRLGPQSAQALPAAGEPGGQDQPLIWTRATSRRRAADRRQATCQNRKDPGASMPDRLIALRRILDPTRRQPPGQHLDDQPQHDD
jgi:hypothetical protein